MVTWRIIWHSFLRGIWVLAGAPIQEQILAADFMTTFYHV
jgi:hypothetical protein